MKTDLFSPAQRVARLLRLASGILAAAFSSMLWAQTNVRSGWGSVAGANIVHPQTGYTYDQVLMTGPTVTVAADPGEIVRVSLTDESDDVVQIEFSGAGSLTIELDPATYRPPAPAVKYRQPDVLYVKGRAAIRVDGPGPDTFVSIFSVGRGNAVNQGLFPDGMAYDAMADVRLVQVNGAQMGGILAGNARFGGDAGQTGIHASDTAVIHRVVVGEIDARGSATPALRIGAGSALGWDAGAILVAGGDLRQSNGLPVDASSGNGVAWPRINAVGGTLSSGVALPPSGIDARFASKAPSSIVVDGVARSTRGLIPASFDELLDEAGFDALDFGDGAAVRFSGGNTGTYAITINTAIEGILVSGQITGGYSYVVTGENQNRMTFTLGFDRILLSGAGLSFNGTVQSLAEEAGEPLPVRISATVEYTTMTTGTFAMAVTYTNGFVEQHSGTFDEERGLDFEFL